MCRLLRSFRNYKEESMRRYRPIKYQLRRRLEKFSCRIANLPKHDRRLVKIFMSGCTFSQIGYMASVSPGTVSRRLVRIVKRLSSANYIFALGNNDNKNPSPHPISIAESSGCISISRTIVFTRLVSTYRNT